jgi:hypothetical protein
MGCNKFKFQLLKSTPDICLNHRLLESAIDLESKSGGSVFIIKRQFVLSSSPRNSQKGNVKLLKDLSGTRDPGYDSNSGLSKNSENFIRDMARAIAYQKYRIFIPRELAVRLDWEGARCEYSRRKSRRWCRVLNALSK